MNRALASFVFTGETLFNLGNAAEDTGAAPSPPKIPGTLILVDEDPDRDFLVKILASVGIADEDMEILPSAQFPGYDPSALHQVERIIAFGDISAPPLLANTGEKYRPVMLEGKKILRADSLRSISLNRANEKRNLWNALKEMFGVS